MTAATQDDRRFWVSLNGQEEGLYSLDVTHADFGTEGRITLTSEPAVAPIPGDPVVVTYTQEIPMPWRPIWRRILARISTRFGYRPGTKTARNFVVARGWITRVEGTFPGYHQNIWFDSRPPASIPCPTCGAPTFRGL